MENPKTTQVDLRQSPAYGLYMQSIGWKTVAISTPGQIFIRPLGILGSIAKMQRVNLPLPWAKVNRILHQHRVWMTKLEPINSLPLPYGFRPDRWPLLATKTLRIDLTPSLQLIKTGFKKDARYCLRKTQRLKLPSSQNDFKGFCELWQRSARVKRLWIPPRKHFDALVDSFGNNCFCITIDNSAGALVLMHAEAAYYYYAAALPEAKRKLLPYQVAWECIQEAKNRGCTVWDWEGIFDSRWPTKSWQGFTHFKKSFGGHEVTFPGSFTRWF